MIPRTARGLAVSGRPCASRLVAVGLRAYATSDVAPKNDGAKNGLKEQRDAHIEKLKKYYPPHLIRSIVAAEASVTPEQWQNRKRSPTLEFAPSSYADDFAKPHEFFDYAREPWLDQTSPRQPVPKQNVGDDSNKGTMSSNSASAINVTQLSQLTGYDESYIRQLTVKTILLKMVVNMTGKGKQGSHYAMVVVGDRNGMVGLGEGRDSKEATGALAAAHWDAVKNMVFIPRFQDRTIYGSVDHKKGAVVMTLRAAAPGSGLQVNHVIHEICRAAGIKDLSGNVYRSRNRMNVAKTALEALSSHQKVPEAIAAGRGKKVVDVTNSYYAF